MSPRGNRSRTDAMELSQLDLTTLELPGPSRTCPVALVNGSAPVEFFLHKEEWFRAPFGASHFNNPEATRLSLEFDVSHSTALPAMQALDEAIVAAALRQGLFKTKTEQEVRESYHSLVVSAPKYNQLRFRTKFNTRGLALCYFWKHPERTRLNPEDDLKVVFLRPHLQLKSFWYENGKWGMSVDCLNVLVKTADDAVCPF